MFEIDFTRIFRTYELKTPRDKSPDVSFMKDSSVCIDTRGTALSRACMHAGAPWKTKRASASQQAPIDALEVASRGAMRAPPPPHVCMLSWP